MMSLQSAKSEVLALADGHWAAHNAYSGTSYSDGTPHYIATDFVLKQDAAVERLGFTTIQYPNLSDSFAINWILLPGGAVPGGAIASGQSVATGQLIDAIENLYDRVQYSFAIPSIVLAAGTYFLALHSDDGSRMWAFGSSADSGPSTSLLSAGTSGPWYNVGIGDFSFRVEGTVNAATNVPEPASLALLGLGLLGMALALRRTGGHVPPKECRAN
jgi:hypothetical protein